MFSSIKTILVLAPHTDDAEFGCGGTLSRVVEEGHRVICVSFSAAEQSVLPHLPRNILRIEVKAATSVLGISEENCIILDFEVRRFPENRQAILDEMIRLNRTYEPELVFMPSPNDTHQDHHTVAMEGFRAFKRTTMLGYEVPRNNLDFRTSCFVALEERHVAAKVKALAQYQSQAHRSYASEECIRSLLITRGAQIGKHYAETFELIRLVWS